MPVTRGAVSRRLRANGLSPAAGARLRTTVPRDRRSWSLLTGETLPPAPLPASRDEALALPAFGRGVELIASTVANTPLRGFRWNPGLGIDERLADQPLILTDPDPLTTPWHWKFSAAKDLVEAGNHVSLLGDDVDWRTGRPSWLYPLPIEDIGLLTDPHDPAWWGFAVGGVVLDRSVVLHVSAGNRSGEVLGQGIIGQYSTRLGEQVTAEEWAGRYLRGGGLPPAIIQWQGIVDDDQLADFRRRWRGMVDTGEATIIPAGATVTPLVSDAQKQQLVEARQWNAQQAAIMLGIPHHKLGLPGPNMTYQNAVEADIAWEKDTVDRWLQPIAETMSKYLLPAGTVCRPDYTARLRTDTKTQAEVLTVLTGGEAILSRDEARQMIGRPPVAMSTAAGSTPDGVPNLGAQEVK